MSLSEVKEELKRMTVEERAEVERYLRVLRVVEAPGFKDRIAEAHAAMDAGRKVTQEEIEAFVAQRRKRDH